MLFNYKVFLGFLVVSSYLLHSLRGLIPGYVAVPGMLSLVVCVFLYKRFKDKPENFLLWIISIFVFFIPVLLSYIVYPDESYLIPFGRYFFMIPFFVFALFFIDGHERLSLIMKWYVFYIVLAGFSIFYQMRYGAISWLPDSSERAGLVRFSSLAGSLTSFGVMAGLALPFIFEFFSGKVFRIFILLFVISAMLSTLQKAAMVNIGLFFLYVFLAGSMRNKFFYSIIFFTLVIVSLSLAYYFNISYVVATIENTLRVNGGGNTDVGLVQSIVDRLWLLPSVAYEKHGISGLIFGVGVAGAAGALGLPSYPMSHNGLFDLLFVGGFVYFSFFIILYVVMIMKSLGYKKGCSEFNGKVLNLCVFSIVYIFINSVFSGVLFYHPYGGLIFYSILAFLINESRRVHLKFMVGN